MSDDFPSRRGREQDDVLPGQSVGLQLGELSLPVSEGFIERQGAEAKRIGLRLLSHDR